MTLTLINLDSDQEQNTSKIFSAKVMIQKDEIKPALAEYIKSTYGTDSTLLLHNASLTNGANDGSYRYAGASESVKNYVCFGSTAATCPADNLYRIIGVFGDQVKLIKSDYADSTLIGTDGDYQGTGSHDATYYKGSQTVRYNYYWNYKAVTSAINNWTTSLLNKTNLNTNYLNNIGSTWSSKIATTTWKVGGNTGSNISDVTVPNAYKNEIVSPAEATTYNAKIGLMYVSDYGFATSQANWTTNMGSLNNDTNRNNNWMHMGATEWTISRTSGNTSTVFYMGDSGYANSGYANTGYVVRPAFYLASSVKMTSGSGTAADPYRIDTTENIISFTINGTQYTTIEGTTWYEWTTANPGLNLAVECGGITDLISYKLIDYVRSSSGNVVHGNDMIINNEVYSHSTSGSSSDNCDNYYY